MPEVIPDLFDEDTKVIPDLFDNNPGIVKDLFPDKPKKSLKDLAFQPISKTLTGKSLEEHVPLLKKTGQKIASERRKVSVPEAFIRQFPAAQTQAGINMFDVSPADVGIMAAMGPISKIPVKGVPLGEIASKVPINMRMGKNIAELAKYEGWLQKFTPLSSRMVTIDTPLPMSSKVVESTGELKSKVNLEKYQPEVATKIEEVLGDEPGLLARRKISHAETIARADKLKSTPIVNTIISDEGALAAEALRTRQTEDAVIRTSLQTDLSNLAASIKDTLIKRQTQTAGRLGAELGRALEQQKIVVSSQQELADLINKRILEANRSPVLTEGGKQSLIDGLIDFRKKVLSPDFNPSWFDKGYEFWINNILSGINTHTVNATSNAAFAGIKPLEKAAYSSIDTLLGMKTGKRTHYFSEIPQQLKGAAKAIFTKEELPTGIAQGTKLDTLRPGAIKGIKGKVIRTPTQALVKEDNFSKRLVGFMETYGRAEAIAKQEGLTGKALVARRNQLIANPTEKLVEEVNKEQLLRTFQDVTGLGEFLSKLPQKGLRWIIPFRNTPASILSRAAERTPLGIAKVISKGLQVKAIPYPQDRMAVDIGNSMMGVGVSAWVFKNYLEGNMTGAPPKDKAKRDLFYAQGKQPYSFKIGENWVPFSRVEPIGTAIMYLTDFFQGYDESDKVAPVEKLTEASFKMSYSLANKTFLGGITNVINAMSDPEQYGESFLGQLSGGFIPFSGALKNVRDVTDTTVRQPQGIPERLMNRIPGLSEQVPAKISSLGEIIQRKPVGLSKWTPFPITAMENNAVADELLRLDITIGYPSKKMGDSKLTREEYDTLLMKIGGSTVKTLQTIISSPGYKNMPDTFKEKMINNIIRKIKDVNRNILKIERYRQQDSIVE